VTEVVYRLYETVDELSSVIENARSVPMSGGSCMVPRDVVLAMIRPEAIELMPHCVEAKETPNAGVTRALELSGRIEVESYEGPTVDLRLHIGPNLQVRVHVPQHVPVPAVGEEVRVRVDPDDIWCLKAQTE
jgi:ABC-type Fe3+/spermidine/putrescine transport system ATPase subunit